ncbi:MAG: sulfatase-like hydrolase/transferase [Planctomycetaceae bacterium]
MRTYLTWAFLLVMLVLCSRVVDAKPLNVLIIYTDDQGTVDAGCYGSQDLVTPNIDRLAKTGVRFTQMYAPSAICSSSRAGLMTGRFPVRAGVSGNVSSTHGEAGMPTGEVTLAELFKGAGYRTGHVGKWHLGYTPATMPNGQGFDSSFGHMGGCIDNYSHFFYWQGPNRHDLWRDGQEVYADGRYFPDLMTEECLRLLDQQDERPFFIYWAINVPHYPLQATDKWRARYQDVPNPRGMYGAFVSTMDERIGTVLDRLEALGLREQTIVLFQSDHGHSTEERTFSGGGSAGPYRGAKGCLFEGGIRVPAIVSCPGTIPQGVVRDQLATGCDWFPTLADLCGLDMAQSLPDSAAVPHHLDGRSLSDVIVHDKPTPHESFYWQLGAGPGAQWVVRHGDWKLLGNAKDTSGRPLTKNDHLFLVNLVNDPQESKNLAVDHPEELRELKSLREKYVQSLK